MEILTTTTLPEQLTELSTVSFNVGTARKQPVLEQNKKNAVHRDLMNGLYDLLATSLGGVANIFRTADGIAIEVDNDDVRAKYPDGNGTITMIVDLTMKSLEYDAYEEHSLYLQDLEMKKEKKLAAEAKKKK